MSKEKRRVPKLRFPGFTEDWEQRKLSEVTTCFDNLRVPVTASDRVPGKIPYYGANGIQDYVSGYTHSGEFVLIAEDGANDLNDYPIQYVNGAIWVNNHAHVIAGYKEKLENKFLSYSLKTVKMSTFIVGGGRSKLNLKALLEIPISMPNHDEQCCIGKFIETIDKTITLHQRKLDNLKLKKKALLQKLFPKNGERYPELRFPGFTDAWEQCKLGEIFEYLQNNTLSRDSLNYKNPNIKNIHYGDILVKFDEILDGFNKDIPYINSEVDLSKFSKSLLRDGDIIFSDTAEDDTVGKAIELQNVNVPFILSGLHTIPCRPLIPFGKGYLGNFLNSDSYRLQLRPLVQGIKVSSISKSALKDTMIEYPKNLDEQEKIGNLFYYIAKMITLHQRKLDHLQLQKKALLQQMFV